MIYCVEDDSNIRDLIVYTLQNTGFEARGLDDGYALKKALAEKLPELILLDIMLPGEDGIRILRQLRASAKTKRIPVIMVTAKGSEYDKVMGLDLGADDYVAKPFSMLELVSRIRAVLRRSNTGEGKDKLLTCGAVTLDAETYKVSVNGTEAALTLKEFELLRRLMERPDVVLSRDRLLADVWGYDFCGETRTVDVHVRTLRRKLGEASAQIETVRGVGYRIRDKVL